MKEIAIVGGERFTLGFQVAGINKAFTLSQDYPDQTVRELMENPDIGLILMSENSSNKLSPEMREQVTNSVDPVFLIISEEDSNEELRKMIKKSIGVDLWNQ